MKEKICDLELPGQFIIPYTNGLTPEEIDEKLKNNCRIYHYQDLGLIYDQHKMELIYKFRYIIPGGIKMVQFYAEVKMLRIESFPGSPIGPLLPGMSRVIWAFANDDDGNIILRTKMGDCKQEGTFEIILPISGLQDFSSIRFMIKLFCCDSKEFEVKYAHTETNFQHLLEKHAFH